MIQIRENCFETNSSSVHTLCMCSDSEYSKWAKDCNSITSDSYLFDGRSLVSIADVIEDYNKYDEEYNGGENKVTIEDVLDLESTKRERFIYFIDEDYYTRRAFFDNYDYESYYDECVTPGGEKVIAFGHYGYNG